MVVLVALLSVSGCQSSDNTTGKSPQRKVDVSTETPGEDRSSEARGGSAARRSTEPITPTDACAMRLHDLSGPLLFYYAMNQRMPARLEELQNVPGAEPGLSFACPVSGKPYSFAPGGVTVPNLKGVVVIYDAEASHSDHHWAIAVAPQPEGQPLLSRVVAVAPGQLPKR